MAQSFTKKTIAITVTVSGMRKRIEGLACKCRVSKLGLPDKNKASVSVWGLSLDDMAAMTTLSFGPLRYASRNHMVIEAGERGGALSRVFSGNIMSAWADFNGAPDVEMKFEAMTGGYAALIAQSPVAASGTAKAAELCGQFARECGLSFVNQGVDVSVDNSVYSGSPLEKAQAVAKQVGADLIIDDDRMTLLPRGETLKGGSVAVLSPETGMIGYPTFTNNGITVKSFFNPSAQRGGQVKISSIVPRASGTWRITRVDHDLSAYDPRGGPWETTIEATYGAGFLAGSV